MKGGITMTLKEAITLFSYHQRSNLKARTVRSYQPLLKRFQAEFGERSLPADRPKSQERILGIFEKWMKLRGQ
jgi:hypothetical protein